MRAYTKGLFSTTSALFTWPSFCWERLSKLCASKGWKQRTYKSRSMPSWEIEDGWIYQKHSRRMVRKVWPMVLYLLLRVQGSERLTVFSSGWKLAKYFVWAPCKERHFRFRESPKKTVGRFKASWERPVRSLRVNRFITKSLSSKNTILRYDGEAGRKRVEGTESDALDFRLGLCLNLNAHLECAKHTYGYINDCRMTLISHLNRIICF